MLGIIIGVSAVIALMSIGRGAQAQVTAQIQSLGTNLLFIRPGATRDQGGVRSMATQAPTLTLEDSDAVASLPNVAASAPELDTGAQLLANGLNWSTRVIGVTPEYSTVRNTPIAAGDWISRTELDSRSSVVVLGDTVAQQLFPDGDPIGQTVRMSVGGRTGNNFRVIGVAQAKGASGLGNTDDTVYVPITTVMARLFAQRTARGAPNVSTINVEVASETVMDDTVSQIGDLLRTRHKVAQDDFTVQSQQDFLNTFCPGSSTTIEVCQLRKITKRLVEHLKVGEEQKQGSNGDYTSRNCEEQQFEIIACCNVCTYTEDDGGAHC